MADPIAALREGLQDRYAFERELGRGGMATVWLARDLKHDRPVALKVLHPELAATMGPERFQREIRLAARLQHPHILTVLDSGETAGRLWFTMPYVEGESLRERLRRERQLPLEDALRIAREAAQALQYAHGQDVVHRDIKPENLLITRDGNTLVADFGVARALGAGGEEQLTETGLAIGTPAYMSPEQAAGERGLDARTDTYSLAAVLYEALVGEPPYTGATTQAMLVRRLTEPPPSARAVRSSVPESVDLAIRKALATVPADRFSTVSEFARALATQAAGQATTASPAAVRASDPAPPAPAAPTVPPRRNRVPLAAMTLVLGMVIGLGLLFAWRRNHGDGPSRDARTLAVLPFENLGDPADAYFADGVTDEIRGKLGQLPGLEVIARGSSNEYRATSKRSQEIARELGADYLLTGTVRWQKGADGTSRVRVIPELVEVRNGDAPRGRWQEPFDASLTNVFEVQADIARKVASSLGVALADSVRSQLASRPTANVTAYDAYLQGEAASQGMTAQDPPSLRRAIGFYERAVSLDSAFVPAWARLSQALAQLYAGSAPTAAMGEQALMAAEQARRLGPNRPEGYLALGQYYRRVPLDNARALTTYEAGLRIAPNDVDLLTAAAVSEQALGGWESAMARFKRAAVLDPRSANSARRYGYALLALRRYAEAETVTDDALRLAPTDLTIFQQKVMVALARGDTAQARQVLRASPAGIDSTALIAYFATFEDLWWMLDDAQQRRLLTLPPSAFDEDRATWGLVRAQVYHHRGQAALARAYADSAASTFTSIVREAPNDGQQHALLGLALAYAGRASDAVEHGRRGVELQPVSRDAYLGPYVQLQLARIHLLAGHPDEALDLLEPLVRIPNTLSPGWLRVDPTWNGLREHPRFRKLVEGTA
jgi:serine/threonine-protein kinase